MAYRTDAQVVEVIRELLGARPQAEFAAAVGIESTAFNKVLKGTRRLALGELVAIAGQLGVDPQVLLVDQSEDAVVFRADADQEVLDEAQVRCLELIDNFLLLEALAGR